MEPAGGNGERSVQELLEHAEGVLGSGSISFALGLPAVDVEAILDELRRKGVVSAVPSYGAGGWVFSGEPGDGLPSKDLTGIMGRLAEYALSSPGATLSELMTVLRWKRLPARDRTELLLRAMRGARELGEFRLIPDIFMRITELEDLAEGEAREVLCTFLPRRLRGYSIEKAENFVLECIQTFRSPSDRALALTRLGELESIQNRASAAEEHLLEAMELSLRSEYAACMPDILESLAELPRDFRSMNQLAARIEDVIGWAGSLDDQEIITRIQASAALAQSGLRMDSLAERTIFTAMSGVAFLPVPVRLAAEWCRARIYIASGRGRAAMNTLQRALMLAESAGDRLTMLEILNTIVSEMKERSGYTMRNLISIMDNVSGRSAGSPNISIRAYALENLTDMYMRTLQFRKSRLSAGELAQLSDSLGMHSADSLSEWCTAYMGFLTGRDGDIGSGDGVLPGTSGFLAALLEGLDPEDHAAAMSEKLMTSPGEDMQACLLVLAMEAFARGAVKASSAIAAALDSTFSGSTRDPYISWKLCVSGMLSTREIYSEDFFHSAQVLSRQLDNLLLVWLILRCRLSLDLERGDFGWGTLLMLLSELDGYVLEQLEGRESRSFIERSGAGKRREMLVSLTGRRECPAPVELKGILSGMASGSLAERMLGIGGISSRISGRSEISASLEILGRLTDADRVMALRVVSGEIEVIEGYGTGKWRMPGEEARNLILGKPAVGRCLENYGVTPFGSRRCLVVPVGGAAVGTQKRTLIPERMEPGSYLLVETECPIPEYGPIPEFLMDIIRGQVTAALRLRSREAMAYMDRMTGAVIGHSWTGRLQEMTSDRSRENTVSVLAAGVDGLQEVNRLFGYRVGDGILRAVVSTIRGVLRPNDMLGRLTGDILGVMLPDTGEDDARLVADRICGEVSGVDLRPDGVPVTVSVGIASVESPQKGHDLVLGRAMEAMQAAKVRGGNRTLQWSEDLDSPDMPVVRLFCTGDPGWDHAVFSAVMDLLQLRETSLRGIAEKLRDALRSVMVYIDDGAGNEGFVGSRFLRSMVEGTGAAREGIVTQHQGMLGKYDALSAGLDRGGRLLAAWDSPGGISPGVRNVFSALAGLSGLLTRRMG
ncbi:MAG: hypothetical protein AVO35_06405 [Candidatus Aegiribacteria sp. MLS_C]|nr:MAG: hypothetical protein AVO35_06405 [Candidatus Aegiribacteria sp. MLS_C]